MRVGWFLVVLGLLCACRVQPPEDYWIESHGETKLSRIVALSQGAVGIGAEGDLYLYPGGFAAPWRRLLKTSAHAAGASSSRVYFLDEEGVVFVLTPDRGAARRWDHSEEWHAEAVASDDEDTVFIIAEGRPFLVEGRSLEPLPCHEVSVAVSAARGQAYLVARTGALFKANRENCEPIPTPGPVDSVAARGGRLAIVVDGSVYDRSPSGSWRLLPRPVRYRSDGDLRVRVAEVAASANYIWARDTEGFVYIFSEMS